MARSEQLRQLALQLASLASLEDVVTHRLQSLLESPSRLVAQVSSTEQAQSVARLWPRPRSRSPLPKAAPGRPRGSIPLSERGPTGLSVKSCPAALPIARFPPTAALAPRLPLLAVVSLGASPVRPAPLLRPSLVPRLLNPVLLPPGRLVEVVPLAPLRLGVESVTSTAGTTTLQTLDVARDLATRPRLPRNVALLRRLII